jgi:hypothetical protein
MGANIQLKNQQFEQRKWIKDMLALVIKSELCIYY